MIGGSLGTTADPADLMFPIILVAHADSRVRKELSVLLPTLGFWAVTATTEAATAREVAAQYVDVVLVGPVHQTTAARARFGSLRRARGGLHLPIVVMGRWLHAGDRVRAAAAGADRYLPYPTRRSSLRRTLTQLTEQRTPPTPRPASPLTPPPVVGSL